MKEVAEDCGVDTTKERHISKESGIRTDVTLFFHTGETIETDVSVTDPSSSSHREAAAKSQLSSALAVAARKNKEYGHIVKEQGAQFFPIIFEITGATLPATAALFHKLHDHALALGKVGAPTVQQMFDRLTCAVYRGTGQQSMLAVGRVLGARAGAKSRALAGHAVSASALNAV